MIPLNTPSLVPNHLKLGLCNKNPSSAQACPSSLAGRRQNRPSTSNHPQDNQRSISNSTDHTPGVGWLAAGFKTLRSLLAWRPTTTRSFLFSCLSSTCVSPSFTQFVSSFAGERQQRAVAERASEHVMGILCVGGDSICLVVRDRRIVQETCVVCICDCECVFFFLCLQIWERGRDDPKWTKLGDG